MKRVLHYLPLLAIMLLWSVRMNAETIDNVQKNHLKFQLNTETQEATVCGYYYIDGELPTSFTIPAQVTYEGLSYDVVSVTGFSGNRTITEITFPETVKRVLAGAFRGCSSLTKLNLNEGLVSIEGDWSFSGIGIEELILPSTVTKMAGFSFEGCKNLKNVKLPKRMTNLDGNVFTNCTALESVTLPGGLLSINPTFYNTGLKSIYIPASVTSISNNAFYGTAITSIVVDEDNKTFDSRENCNAVIRKSDNCLICGCATTVIPDNVKSIQDGAFASLRLLTEITIPSNVTTIGANAFQECSNLGKVKLQDNSKLKSIGNKAFYNCLSLTEINLPSNIDNFQIGTEAFKQCKSLKSISIPEGTQTIPNSAFYDCPKITDLEIPSTMSQIADNAFWMEEKLGNIRCHAVTPPTIGLNTFYGVEYDDCIVYVPGTAVELYKEATYWKKFKNIKSLTTPVTSITLNAKKLTLAPNAMFTLAATVLPADATDNSITWASSSPTDVAVTATGMVIALTGNGALITATANDGSGVVATCYVNMVKTANLFDGTEYVQSVDENYDEINYTRTFNNTKWQALYLPFSMSYEDWSEDFDVAIIHNFNMPDEDFDGVPDKASLELHGVPSGTLYPNHPYLIRAKSTGEKTLTVKNATLYAPKTEEFDCSNMSTRFIFKGTYTTIPGTTMMSEGYYAVAGGSLKQAGSTSASLAPYRWYLKLEDRGGQLMKLPNSIKIYMIGEDEAEETSLEEIMANSTDEAPTFDLRGQRIMGQLKPGMYIRNGKKIIVR